MNRSRVFQWLVCSLLWLFSHPGLAAEGFDVVTMKNGEIHNGTVALERFSLATAYGEITVPYNMMGSLQIGRAEMPDRLTTRFGDQFSGRLVERELTILRVLDVTLPVTVDDVMKISFTPRKIRQKLPDVSDAVVMQNGDRFAASIKTGNFLLKSDSGIKMLNRKAIHLLDLVVRDDDAPLIRITPNSGNPVKGTLMITKIDLETRYGSRLNLPIDSLSTLAFATHHQSTVPNFNFRRRLNPSDLIVDTMQDGSLGPELLALRGGHFMRGDLQGNGDGDEQPARKITLVPFAIGLYEITFEEYDKYCEDTGTTKPEDEDWGRGRRPVVNVSWQDALKFTEWLSNKTGHKYRLPTDAEWEYAARGNTVTRFWWGNEPEDERANCEGCNSLWDGEKSSPVGKFLPNPFGLHDTSGNVFEWVADCWHDTYAEAPADGRALDKKDCGKRVIRGGAWSFPPHEVRSANRWRDFPARRSDDTGFRVVRELP